MTYNITKVTFTCKRCSCQWKGDQSKCQQCGTTLWDVDREDLVAFEREPRFGITLNSDSSGKRIERSQLDAAKLESMTNHITDLEADNAKLRRRVELLLDLVINQQGVK